MALRGNPFQLFGLGQNNLLQATGEGSQNRLIQSQQAQKERLARFHEERRKKNQATAARKAQQQALLSTGIAAGGALIGGGALGALGSAAAPAVDMAGIAGSGLAGPVAATTAIPAVVPPLLPAGQTALQAGAGIEQLAANASIPSTVSPTTLPTAVAPGTPAATGLETAAKPTPTTAPSATFAEKLKSGIQTFGRGAFGNGNLLASPVFQSFIQRGIGQLGASVPEPIKQGVSSAAGALGNSFAKSRLKNEISDQTKGLVKSDNIPDSALNVPENIVGQGLNPSIKIGEGIQNPITPTTGGIETVGGKTPSLSFTDVPNTAAKIGSVTEDPAASFIRQNNRQPVQGLDQRFNPPNPNEDRFAFGNSRGSSALSGALMGLGGALSGQNFIGQGLSQSNANRDFERGIRNDAFDRFDINRKFDRQIDNDYYTRGTEAFGRARQRERDEAEALNIDFDNKNEVQKAIDRGAALRGQEKKQFADDLKEAYKRRNQQRKDDTQYFSDVAEGGLSFLQRLGLVDEPAPERTNKSMSRDQALADMADPNASPEKRQAAAIALGLSPRAGQPKTQDDIEQSRLRTQTMQANLDRVRNAETPKQKSDAAFENIAQIIAMVEPAKPAVGTTGFFGDGGTPATEAVWPAAAKQWAKELLKSLDPASEEYREAITEFDKLGLVLETLNG